MSILPGDKVVFLTDFRGGFKKGEVYDVIRYNGRGDGNTEEEQRAVINNSNDHPYYYANDPAKINQVWKKYNEVRKNTKPDWL